MENNKIDFGSEFLNKEVEKIIKANGGNGYHRILGIINTMKEQGKTEIEIANVLRDMRKN